MSYRMLKREQKESVKHTKDANYEQCGPFMPVGKEQKHIVHR